MAPQLPVAEWVTFPEAVALVAPPLCEDAVREAIAAALREGRLFEKPQPIHSYSEIAWLVEEGDAATRNAAIKSLAPIVSAPQSWDHRFSEGRVDWSTGKVLDARRHFYVPALYRDAVLALFEVTDAKPAAKPAARPTISEDTLLEFLVSVADGQMTEAELRRLAEEHFSSVDIPEKSRWRPAYGKLPSDLKRRAGQTNRTLEARQRTK